MSRLLLVDDNPSIHRIAESLLAPTDVVLVCVDSGAEALDRISRGERFDVALVDTAMPGMDGWTLLSRLRAMDATARMPIALMAGVLDQVDPAKLAKAPIQGFLKKPIELRELGERVKALLATPVVISSAPVSLMPAMPGMDLEAHAEAALPAVRSDPEEAPAGFVEADLGGAEPEADLLVLTAEDLWPEDSIPSVSAAATATPVLSHVHLELEELDLDSLSDLTGDPLPAEQPLARVQFEPGDALDLAETFSNEDHLITLSGLEDLDTLPEAFQLPPAFHASELMQDRVVEPDDSFAHLPVAASLIEATGMAAVTGWAAHEFDLWDHEPAPVVHEAVPDIHPPVSTDQESVPTPEPEPAAASAAGGQGPAVPGHAGPESTGPAPVSAELARAVVQALLADPVLVDALLKAVVARMGDQVLREIAWEIMPDLAGRLQR